MSRTHCLLRTTDEAVFVSDLSSGNGTRVNGVAIEQETALQPGDTLSLGAFEFELLPEQPPAPPSQEIGDAESPTEAAILGWLVDDRPDSEATATADTTILKHPSSALPAKTPEQKAPPEPSAQSPEQKAPPSFRYLSVEKKFDVAIVRLKSKRFTPGDIDAAIHELSTLAERLGTNRILLNLKGVTYLPSVALSKLTRFQQTLEQTAGELHLCDLHDVIREVFRTTRLHERIEIFDTENAAFDAFWK